MIGKNKDKEFKLEDYEEFYEHHQFVETSDEDAINVHEIIPRFGWGFDMVEKHQPKNLLDLGTLDGSFPITIARHFGIPCAGIDLTRDGINLARERAARFGIQAKFAQGTIEETLEEVIKEGTKFDMVTCFEVIEHVKDPKRLLKLIDQVLAPVGLYLSVRQTLSHLSTARTMSRISATFACTRQLTRTTVPKTSMVM